MAPVQHGIASTTSSADTITLPLAVAQEQTIQQGWRETCCRCHVVPVSHPLLDFKALLLADSKEVEVEMGSGFRAPFKQFVIGLSVSIITRSLEFQRTSVLCTRLVSFISLIMAHIVLLLQFLLLQFLVPTQGAYAPIRL
jgi:hypothetical protein